MRARLSLLLVGILLLPYIQAARTEAGPFAKQYQVVCKLALGAPLTYPGLSNPGPVPWSMSCGKDKNQAHPLLGFDDTFCQMSSVSVNSKKPLKKPPASFPPPGKLKASNCNWTGGGLVLPIAGIGPNCEYLSGVGVLSLTNKSEDKPILLNVQWMGIGHSGMTMITVGEAPDKPGTALGTFSLFPATMKKGESCVSGADQTKIAGTLYLVGDRPRSEAAPGFMRR